MAGGGADRGDLQGRGRGHPFEAAVVVVVVIIIIIIINIIEIFVVIVVIIVLLVRQSRRKGDRDGGRDRCWYCERWQRDGLGEVARAGVCGLHLGVTE